jgi:hypothetical protein
MALDMEASAFLELCQHSFKDISCLGVVKGVSDFGDEEKNMNPVDKDQALERTADALRDWITHRIPTITWEHDYSTARHWDALRHETDHVQAKNQQQKLLRATTTILSGACWTTWRRGFQYLERLIITQR